MKIAVTYEGGNVFQHFGHTEQFKVYDVADGKVADAQVVSTNGTGHGALAVLLSDLGVDTLICGGIGGGAQMALKEAGVQLYGGVSGSADVAMTRMSIATITGMTTEKGITVGKSIIAVDISAHRNHEVRRQACTGKKSLY